MSDAFEVIKRFRDRRVLVIGDLIADEYVYGRVARVSREAPVLILEYDSTDVVPGGAGNAASNVAALGAQVRLVAITGHDEPGRRVIESLPSRIDRKGVIRLAGQATTIKTRILAGGIHSAKQQVVRIDRLSKLSAGPNVSSVSGPKPRLRDQIARAAATHLARADAILVSDYGLGVVTPQLVKDLAKQVRRGGRRIPIVVDSRYDLMRYRGLTACTPNQSEVEQFLGLAIDNQPRPLERAGRELLHRTRMQAVLITRGGRGMSLFQRDLPTVHIPIFGSDQIADVTGAGDTVIAAMTLALAAGSTFEEAARLANYAGGLVVMKRGTATVSAAELERAVRADQRAGVER